jgi:Family of unknown function (DUF6174)
MNSTNWLAPVLLLTSTAVAGGVQSSSVRLAAMPGSVSLGGCVPGFVQPSPAVLSRQLALARARWQKSGIHNYSFVFDEIAQPVRFPRTQVSVSNDLRGNIGVSAHTLESGTISPRIKSTTIEHLFRSVEQSIAFARKQPCAELKVRYASDGHPLSLALEQRNVNIADGGGSWTVSSFKRLK